MSGLSIAQALDFGAGVKGHHGGHVEDVVAGGSGDNTAVTGDFFDVLGLSTADDGVTGSIDGVRFHSCTLLVHWRATLAEDETLKLKNVRMQTASAGSNGNPDAGTAVTLDADQETADITLATGGTGGGSYRGVAQFNFNIVKALQFVRDQWTPDLSAANTDTADVFAFVAFGGSHGVTAQAKV